jgi:two-component system, OmpR family, sensor kinase
MGFRTLAGRTPLRVKLIAAVLALVGVAVVIISVAGVIVFRDYLLARADQQVRQQYRLVLLAVQGNEPGFHLQPGQIALGGSFITAWRAEGVQLINPFTMPGAPAVALPDVPVSRAWVAAHAGQITTVGGLHGTDRWRVIVQTAQYYDQFGKRTGTLIVGVDLGDIAGSVTRLAAIDAIVGALVLAGLAIIAVAVVRSSLRPLADIERTAAAIADGDLAMRVPERDPRTEVGRLGQALNAMLAQIEAAFRGRTESEEAARSSARAASRSEDRMRRFVADASHELRTPLTAIRGFAEYYRQRGGGAGELEPAEHDRLMQRVEQEATRMGVLVDDMLLLARLDLRRPLEFRTTDLLAIVADAAHDARVIAPERVITLNVSARGAPLVLGDEPGLRQVVGNLMSNALTHTPQRTPIDITIGSGTLPDSGEPSVVLEVTDHGPGLTDDQIEHVFERFYRTDQSRSRSAGGTGLGLAIVAALAEAHHGNVWVNSRPGEGATFGLALPQAPEARQDASPSPSSPS